MQKKLIDYLLRTRMFSKQTSIKIANDICNMHYPYVIGNVQDILMKYLGGEDCECYETSYEMARRIVRIMRNV